MLRKGVSSDPSERYYQAVKSFLLEPTPVQPHRHLYSFNFHVPAMDFAKISRNKLIPGAPLSLNWFSSGSLTIRARCCLLNTAPPIPDTEFVTADTKWPPHIFMELNGNILEFRRKAHYSKDLPVEVSDFVEGDNCLKISVPENQDQRIPSGYQPVIAVEVVETLNHRSIINLVQERGIILADVTREIIRARLTNSSSDDELALVDSDLSINLVDPFTFSIFSIPVRGKACNHLECFDLETWLNTRLGKKFVCVCPNVANGKCKKCREPSFADKWRCPLCDGDARPYSLRIDGFLVEVREALARDGRLNTKSILVSANGSWRAKEVEPSAADDSDDDNDNGLGSVSWSLDSARPSNNTSMARPAQPQRGAIEIIELD